MRDLSCFILGTLVRNYMFTALIVLAALFQSSENLQLQFEELRQKANAQRKSGNFLGLVQTVSQMERLLNEAPDPIENTAQA